MGTADGWHTQTLVGTGLHFAEYKWPARIKSEQNKAHIAALAASSKPKENEGGVVEGWLISALPARPGVLSTHRVSRTLL